VREGLRPSLKSLPPLLLKERGIKGGEVNKQPQALSLYYQEFFSKMKNLA